MSSAIDAIVGLLGRTPASFFLGALSRLGDYLDPAGHRGGTRYLRLLRIEV